MTKVLVVVVLCLGGCSSLALAAQPDAKIADGVKVTVNQIADDNKVYTVIDNDNTDKLPKNFRTTKDPFKETNNLMPSTKGLAELHASGSAEFSEKSLETIKGVLGDKNVIVVDLREESHLFVNGMPVTWYKTYDWVNLGKSRHEIKQDEETKRDVLHKGDTAIFNKVLKKGPNGTIGKIEPVVLTINTAQTEEELVKKVGYDYFRITSTDHRRPVDDDVDRFVDFARKLDKDTLLHFHCRAGEGRTTTFMVMYDMMYNAKKVSFEGIVQRQFLIGGEDLLVIADDDKVKASCKTERVLFIKKFYEYCQYAHKDDFKTSWSQWIAKHK
jgi:hypothetical protein